MVIRATYLNAQQGAYEQRSEAYIRYVERAAQKATQLCVKSIGRVGGFANKQANAIRRSYAI